MLSVLQVLGWAEEIKDDYILSKVHSPNEALLAAEGEAKRLYRAVMEAVAGGHPQPVELAQAAMFSASAPYA